MNQQPRQGGSWQPNGNSGKNSGWGSTQPNAGWGTAGPNSGWGSPQNSPSGRPASPSNSSQWSGSAGSPAAAGNAPAPQQVPTVVREPANSDSSPEAPKQTRRRKGSWKPKKAPLADWSNAAQVALALVIAALGLYAFSYLQDRVMNYENYSPYYFFIQFGLYFGLGLVFVVNRWLTSTSSAFLWSTMLAAVWLSVFFLRMDNRPWMFGILALLAGIVFPIGLLLTGIIADARGEQMGTAGAYFLSLSCAAVILGVFTLLYYMASGQESGGLEIGVPLAAHWYWKTPTDFSIFNLLAKYPFGQLLAFVLVVSIYFPVANSRSVPND